MCSANFGEAAKQAGDPKRGLVNGFLASKDNMRIRIRTRHPRSPLSPSAAPALRKVWRFARFASSPQTRQANMNDRGRKGNFSIAHNVVRFSLSIGNPVGVAKQCRGPGLQVLQGSKRKPEGDMFRSARPEAARTCLPGSHRLGFR